MGRCPPVGTGIPRTAPDGRWWLIHPSYSPSELAVVRDAGIDRRRIQKTGRAGRTVLDLTPSSAVELTRRHESHNGGKGAGMGDKGGKKDKEKGKQQQVKKQKQEEQRKQDKNRPRTP
jgi:hypothetical protein